MKRTTKRVVVATIATGVLAVSLPISSASAINYTHCGWNDVVRVVHNFGKSTTCFANAGVTNVNLPNVVRVTSGDNKIRWVGSGVVYRLDKYQVAIPEHKRPYKITRLRIF